MTSSKELPMSVSVIAFNTGFIAQASLIMVIGAQNSFVFRQGLQQQHVGAIVSFCIISDIMLAAFGVMGLTSILSLYPAAIVGMEYIAITFLLGYAALSFYRAIKSTAAPLTSTGTASSLSASLALMAGFTWLNPHVWLDTVLLLGTVAQSQAEADKIVFLAGVSLASAMWFMLLGYGAKLMQPLFRSPTAWRTLDGLTGTMMLALAAALILN
jgi:L-lysine exporter family protein LysE/ArgO